MTGVLYYFPFENERETVPMRPTPRAESRPNSGQGVTQQPAGTQLALTQAPHGAELEGKSKASRGQTGLTVINAAMSCSRHLQCYKESNIWLCVCCTLQTDQ